MEREFEYKKRILFVGMPDTAYTTLYYLNRERVNIVAVVPPPANHPAGLTFSNYAKKMGYEVISPMSSVNEPDFIEKIAQLNIDLAVVTSYSQKFSRAFLQTAKDSFINAHPSLLPEYRGANPYSHVILNGESTTGLTIHRMDEGFDTGDIYMQLPLDILPDETMGTLFNKLNRLSGEALVQFLRVYEVNGLPQGVRQLTLPKPKHKAPNILPDSGDTVIRWERSAVELERFVRGLNPFLPAGTRYKGVYVKVFSAEACTLRSMHEPGTICSAGKTVDVATGNGVLKIRSLQFGNYFIGDAADFSQRIKVQTGDKFELMKPSDNLV